MSHPGISGSTSQPRDVETTRSAARGENTRLIARFGELWLKGRNRQRFEERLVKNARLALSPITRVAIERERGQLVITPERRASEALDRLRDVFGIALLHQARVCSSEIDAIAELARSVLEQALEAQPLGRGTDPIPFRVSARRLNKRFPLTSPELERRVADHVLPGREGALRVDLSDPKLTLGIDVRERETLVFARRLRGAGGLPVGSIGRAVCLLSGGIDSPVAAWLGMKRGLETSFASFHSYPYVGARAQRKVERLVRALARFQPTCRLHSIPFAPVQEAIRDRCPTSYRTLLYRRMMHRIGAQVAARDRAQALVTGDSLGQVASQTLDNLACLDGASAVPTLRPLITFDKLETVNLARRIGTYEISIEPEPDCCSLFQPRHPIVNGRMEVCLDAERCLDVDRLMENALAGTEVVEVEGV